MPNSVRLFDDCKEDAKILLFQAEQLVKEKEGSLAAKDEFDMLMDILTKYDKILRQKYARINDRTQESTTAKLLAIDDIRKQIDPTYAAEGLRAVLNSRNMRVPTYTVAGGRKKAPASEKKKKSKAAPEKKKKAVKA